MLLVAIDIDGTIEAGGGPVTAEMVRRIQEKGAFWGVLSARAVGHAKEAVDAMNLVPHFIRNCRVYQRAEELNALRLEFPDYDRYVYIADTKEDEQETLRAGWEYCTPEEFDPQTLFETSASTE